MFLVDGYDEGRFCGVSTFKSWCSRHFFKFQRLTVDISLEFSSDSSQFRTAVVSGSFTHVLQIFGSPSGSEDISSTSDIGFWSSASICLKWETSNFKKNSSVAFKDSDKAIRFADLCLYYFQVCILTPRNNFHFVDVAIITPCWILLGFGHASDLSHEWINCSIKIQDIYLVIRLLWGCQGHYISVTSVKWPSWPTISSFRVHVLLVRTYIICDAQTMVRYFSK